MCVCVHVYFDIYIYTYVYTIIAHIISGDGKETLGFVLLKGVFGFHSGHIRISAIQCLGALIFNQMNPTPMPCDGNEVMCAEVAGGRPLGIRFSSFESVSTPEACRNICLFVRKLS